MKTKEQKEKIACLDGWFGQERNWAGAKRTVQHEGAFLAAATGRSTPMTVPMVFSVAVAVITAALGWEDVQEGQ